jgi:hypothetical protein
LKDRCVPDGRKRNVTTTWSLDSTGQLVRDVTENADPKPTTMKTVFKKKS